MAKRVFITGMGIISAIGNNVTECRNSLKHGLTGIKKAQNLESGYTEVFPFGEVPFSTEELITKAGITNEDGISRTEALALLAVQQSIEDAQLTPVELSSYNTAFISASTVGGMSSTDELHQDVNKIGEASAFIGSYHAGTHTSNIIKRYAIKGVSSTFNTACSSSANAIMLGTKLIKSGRCTRAIVGGSDALAKFTVNGFNALQILSSEPCMPFDENRSGLTLGEGAAYLVLESEDAVENKKIYAEVSGYGNANDAYHPSSISEEAIGIIASISEAIESANLKPSEIDYINTHGTGTENNDISEQTGMHSIFHKVPPFQSTKSYTGHTLAAAGSIEAVFSILSLQHQELYPSLNCANPIKNYHLSPISGYKESHNIKHVLSNSFGFGGNCSSLILSKV